MTVLGPIRKVVFLPELLFCEMAFQSPLVATVCPFRLKQIVSINEMINILKSLGTSHFIDRMRARFKK